MTTKHIPVLLREVVDGLSVQRTGVYVDATFGRGGHSKEILRCLDSNGVLLGIDCDQEAIRSARKMQDPRLIIRQGSFTGLKTWVEELNFSGKVRGVLLDIGVSSPQVDDGARGFSFLRDGPLDMRMDQSRPITAALWLERAKESEIEKVLRIYGEERFSKRIARAIVKERAQTPIATTQALAALVSRVSPRLEKHKNPATRTFQAIRIVVNNELQELTICLEQCLEVLAVGGRLVVISFHSLEDQIVKQFLRKYSGSEVPAWLPLRDVELPRRMLSVDKAIRATPEEVKDNPRARSATLRVMEKIQ